MPHSEPEFSGDRVRFTHKPLDGIVDPEIRGLLELWQRKRGDRRMPARADFDPAELKPWLARLILIEVQREPLDFRYRVSGTEIYDIHGIDLTGKSVRDLTPADYAAAVWRDLAELIETRTPQHVRLEFTNRQDRSRAYDVLRLPLSADGDTVDRVFVLSVFGQEKHKLAEVLRQIRGGEA